MTSLLEVEDLRKSFRVGRHEQVHAVNGVSLTVARGETLGLVGESGSGKTTVARCIIRTVEPTSGRISFGPTDILAMSPRAFRALRARIQMVFQDPLDSLDPRLTAGQIIEEPLLALRVRNRAARVSRVLTLANDVGLAQQLLNRVPRQLSAGQQQRVGIARAIASEPDIVILDEAVSNLDVSSRFEIVELLKSLQSEHGMSYILISHDLETVRYMADRVALMYLGRIVETGPADQTFHEPLHPYTKALVSSVLPIDPDADYTPYGLSGELPSSRWLPVGCALAPRCPEAFARCHAEYPPMISVDSVRAAACYLVEPSEQRGREPIRPGRGRTP